MYDRKIYFIVSLHNCISAPIAARDLPYGRTLWKKKTPIELINNLLLVHW